MQTKTKIGLIIVAVAIAGSATTIGLVLWTMNQNNQPTLRVFMASSLTHVVGNETTAFEKQYNCKLVINSGGSNTLEAQIALGSPCDVFMSAANKWTKTLNSSGLLDNYTSKCNNFTTNKLVVITPEGNTKVTSLLDLANNVTKPKIDIANSSVPVGNYTIQTLLKINSTYGNPGNPSKYKGGAWVNYYGNFMANVQSQEPSDETVVTNVNLNLDYDAGIVYISDVTYPGAPSSLTWIPIPYDVNTIGTYSIGVINQTAQRSYTESASQLTLAWEFVNFWLSTSGQTLLHTYGLGITSPS